MSDPFAEPIASWENFYMLTGTAAATLVGLIFVSVSLHIDFIASNKKDSNISARYVGLQGALNCRDFITLMLLMFPYNKIQIYWRFTTNSPSRSPFPV